ncbi:MAG: protein phosphatase CheZ [Janthinobacterium lividum]
MAAAPAAPVAPAAAAPAAKAAPAAPAASTAAPLVHVDDAHGHEGGPGAESPDAAERMTARIGGLMRMLRDSMRELGLDKQVEQAADAIPDARDRLRYIATMTEQAAERALNATDVAMPLADQLGKDAGALDRRWQEWYDAPQDTEKARALVVETRGFLQLVPAQSTAINQQLMEIMLAQDFQDLTGQVIKKVMDMVHHIEQQLLAVLLENISPERRAELISIVGGGPKAEGPGSLLNGPQVNTDGRTDIVTDQTQVDDLLTELGF